jgi:hypothetical protein
MMANIQRHTIRRWLAIAGILLAIAWTREPVVAQQGPGKPGLSAEQIEVYKAFLDYYRGNSGGYTRIADVTLPVAARTDRCVSGIELEHLSGAQHPIHKLSPEIIGEKHDFALVATDSTPQKHVRVLQLSEVSFDRQHRHAMLYFNFHCGILCGEGQTVVFEKVAGVWKHTRSCMNWIS